MPHIHQLDYRSEGRRPASLAVPLVLLGVVGGMIWALHELAIMPYRPPQDMTTLLDGPTEAIVSFLIGILAVAWAGILFWCIVRLRRAARAA